MRMKMKISATYTTLFLATLLFVSCDKPKVTDIPYAAITEIQIDGLFSETEWDKSKIIDITPNNSLYLMQNDDYLFLGIKNNEDVGRYIDLYLDNKSMGTINFHASMQLGERELHNNWNDTIPEWNWGNNAEWKANYVEVIDDDEQIPFLESVKAYEGFEFQISKTKIRNTQFRMRIEVKDFMGQTSDIIFPSTASRMEKESWLLLEANY